MEEPIGKDDLHGNVLRLVSSRPSGVLKHTASGRSTPRSSPRKWRTAQRELKGSPWSSQWFGVNRLIFWLVLITIWAYIGFLVQSKWAHNDRNKHEFAGYRINEVTVLDVQDASGAAAISAGNSSLYIQGDPVRKKNFSRPGSRDGISLATRRQSSSYWQNSSVVPGRRSTVEHRSLSNAPVLPKVVVINNRAGEVGDKVNRRNTSYGSLVGPFGKIEDRVLGWTAEKRKGTCEKNSNFANLARSKKFVLIFHELSMTGAPISMMELATEILRCGGTVSVVVLSRKGGLLAELNKRGIKVLRDKGKYSFRAANRADLVVAGSAVCSSWIEDYLSYFASKSSRILWWIMENRREYFDRSKKLLDRVKVLMFLAESQSKQWLTWCEEEGIHLRTPPRIVPLSVNDELAFVAGIPCPLNDLSFTVMKMQEKRNILRLAVRREFGLSDNDMLVMSLSSINPGKGQYYLIESVVIMLEQTSLVVDLNIDSSVGEKNKSILRIQDMKQKNSRTSFHIAGHIMNAAEDDLTRMDNMNIANTKRRRPKTINFLSSGDFSGPLIHDGPRKTRSLLLDDETLMRPNLKVLIGSVGSKSNKILYIKDIMHFLSQHPNQSKSLLWTPATTHVASLYAAADVYVINAQGIGETFGRVTIEAMAFGLPVLGTDAGGTKEIVEDKVTGLLHPVGRDGVHVLANNLQFLLRNSSAREEMGSNGRSKVEKMYMKHHMYEKLAVIFAECMRKRQ